MFTQGDTIMAVPGKQFIHTPVIYTFNDRGL